VCDDGNPLTVGDKCVAGICVGGPRPCDTFRCDTPAACKAPGVCGVDDGLASCTYANVVDGTGCNDNNPNTKHDICTKGICAGEDLCTGVQCMRYGPCFAQGVCSAGECTQPVLPLGNMCDDDNSTTIDDQCDGAGHCIGHEPPVNGGLSDWDTCSVACGGGTQTRECDSPVPANGGLPCCQGNFGKAGCPNIQACNTNPCASAVEALLNAQQAEQVSILGAGSDACAVNPCQNSGNCIVSSTDPGGYHCTCLSGYGGNNCQTVVPIASSLDQNYDIAEARVTRLENLDNGVPGTVLAEDSSNSKKTLRFQDSQNS